MLRLRSFLNPKSAIQNPKSSLNGVFVQAPGTSQDRVGGKIMGKIANLERSKADNILVLGKRTKKVKELVRILAEYFNKVCLISDPAEGGKMLPNDNFKVIIVTDSLGVKLNNGLLSGLRGLFPVARLVCLADRMTPEREIDMRSTGLIFLGSYDHFINNYQGILKSAVKPNYAFNSK